MSTVSDLLGADFVCEQCGQRHKTRLKHLLFSRDALEHLPMLCREFAGVGGEITLVADTRTFSACGETAGEILANAGFRVRPVIIPDPESGGLPVCDDCTRAMLEPRLGEPSMFLAVGSGVINDMVKWIAFDREIPYAVVATAASMNGYASDNIAPALKGVKRLLYGRGPVAILSTPVLLASAPAEMTAAGLGDVLAKSVSAQDWRLNHHLFGEYFCPFCANLINEIEPVYMDAPESIGAGEPEGLAALFEALTLTGLAMTMAGTSAPASGGEHLVSHTIDMMAMRDGIEHDFHGRQVGVGTILCTALYERVLAVTEPNLRASAAEGVTDGQFWGRLTEPVETEHVKKRAKTRQALEALAAP
ncbi:MAG: iron-containing alcohol dehydrogenase, partial [Lentisphaeria bacterium]|nr:iron-containing alcohol dehydrogenase [Lentisphaeria bacterium]